MSGFLDAIFNPKPKPAPVKVEGIIKRIGFRPSKNEFGPVTVVLTIEGDPVKRLYRINIDNASEDRDLRYLLLKAGDRVEFMMDADGFIHGFGFTLVEAAASQPAS